MSSALLNGININYEVCGSGPALVLTHGYGATGEMWRPQMDALSDRCQIVAWDMRGHGQTDSPDAQEAYSHESTVQDLRELLLHLGHSRAVLGGLSLGGYISLLFYLTYPEMVSGLILCDTGPGYRKQEARAEWNQMAHERARALEERGFAALSDSPEVRRAAGSHRSPAGLAMAARGILAQKDSRVIDSLPDIAVPTLVIVGENDQPFLPATKYMSDKVPGAQLVVIPNAGHAANLDNPTVFNDAVGSFLATLEL